MYARRRVYHIIVRMGVIQDIHEDLDRGAAQLVAEYRDRLYRDALSFCGDSAEAEDFAFRTFDKAIRKIDTFKGDGAFYEWMKSILLNEIRSARRTKAAKNTVVAELDEESSAPEGTSCAIDDIESASDDAAVRRAVQMLPEDQREAIILHYFLEQPIKRMAEILSLIGAEPV